MNAATTTTSAHARVVIGTGVAVALVAALGFLWLASNRVDTTEHQTFVARLRELSQLNRVVHLDVLRARFGLINHYDRIAESERRIGGLGPVRIGDFSSDAA